MANNELFFSTTIQKWVSRDQVREIPWTDAAFLRKREVHAYCARHFPRFNEFGTNLQLLTDKEWEQVYTFAKRQGLMS